MFNVICFDTGSVEAYQPVSSEIVINADSGEILFSKKENEQASIASLTKIITAITVIENCDFEKQITITGDMVGVEGSSIYLKSGEKYKIKDLLYGLMLRSGNDAAVALALTVSESVNNFAILMNETAKSAGAVNSNFVNPHGLEQKGHYSTAKDLALITAYALKNELFSDIVSTKRYVYEELSSGEKRVFINKNKLLSNFDGADGVKTGYTKYSGRCLVSSATRNGIRLICVVINCASTYERSAELLEKCFEKYPLL